MIYHAYKFRMYPNEAQRAWLNTAFAAVRHFYNAALEQRNIYGRPQGTDPFYRDSVFSAPRQAKELNFKTSGERIGLCDDPELSWLTQAPRDCLDAALRDLDKAFKRFFDKQGGYPSFRSCDRNNSLSFKAWHRKFKNGECVARPVVVFGKDSVKLPKLGYVRYKRHKKFTVTRKLLK